MKNKLQKTFKYFTLILFLTTKIPSYQDTNFVGGFDPIVVDDPIISYWKNTKLSNYHSNFLYKNNSFTFETIKRGDVLKKKN